MLKKILIVFLNIVIFISSRYGQVVDILGDDDDLTEINKRQLSDDYGHMRFGKRDQFDDYGHMRFGRNHE